MCKRFREREFGFRHREGLVLCDGDINTEGTGTRVPGEPEPVPIPEEKHQRPFHAGTAQEAAVGPGVACFHSNILYLWF